MQNFRATSSRGGSRGRIMGGRGPVSSRGGNSSRGTMGVNKQRNDNEQNDDGEWLNPMRLLRESVPKEELPTKDEMVGIDRPSFWKRNALTGERIKRLKYFSVFYKVEDNQQGIWWYIVNAKTLPTVPAPSYQAAIPPQDPAWFDPREPWAGFYPRSGHHHGSIINRVNLPNVAIPRAIEQRGTHQFRLKEEVARPWYELEVLLIELSLFLTRNDALAHLPKYPFVAYPSDYGYLKVFTNDIDASHAVRQSRNAFVRLSTFISFLLSFWRFPLTASDGLAAFECYIERHWQIYSSATRQLVKGSVVGSFDVMKRAGFFIDIADPNNHAWLPYLHIFAEAGLPIYIHAGPEPSHSLHSQSPAHLLPVFDAWTPSRQLFQDATARHQRGQAEVFSVVEGSPLKSYHNLAHLEDNSMISLADFGYEPGMSPFDFKERRLAAIAEWRNNPLVTAYEVQENEGRGMHSKWDPKVHTSMAMFVWQADEDGSVWRRRRLAHSMKQYYFAMYPPSQRLYTPFDHSMDLCSEWDHASGDPVGNEKEPRIAETVVVDSAHEPPPFAYNISMYNSDDDDNDNDNDDSDSDNDNDEAGRPPIPDSLRKRPPPPPPAGPGPSTSLVPELAELHRVLRIRLGYNISIELPDTNKKIALGETKDGPWGTKDRHRHSLKMLGFPETLTVRLDEPTQMAIADVAATLIASTAPANRKHLASRWDIAPSRTSPVQMPNGIGYTRILFRDEERYAIHVTNQPVSEQWWVLVVSPSALLELCRANLNGILAMARYLMSWGIPFAKARPVSLSYIPPTPSPLVHHGIHHLKPDETIPSHVFQRYEQERDKFFKSDRGAMALKEGGFIWRLAKDQVTSKQINHWMKRPTHLDNCRMPHDERRQSMAGASRTLAFYEDSLKTSEIDLILGTCHESPQGNACDKIVYFWPTSFAWRSSGLNTSGWSELAEAWFAERLQLLRAGRAKAYTSSMWRTKLQQLRQTYKAWSYYNRMANVVVGDNASSMA